MVPRYATQGGYGPLRPCIHRKGRTCASKTVTFRRGDAGARAVIGPLTKTRRRTINGHDCVEGSVCVVDPLWERGSIRSPSGSAPDQRPRTGAPRPAPPDRRPRTGAPRPAPPDRRRLLLTGLYTQLQGEILPHTLSTHGVKGLYILSLYTRCKGSIDTLSLHTV